MTEYKLTNKNSYELVHNLINLDQQSLFEFFGTEKVKACEDNYNKRLINSFVGFLIAVLIVGIILCVSGFLGFFRSTVFTLICVPICWLFVCFPMLSLFLAGFIDYFDEMVKFCHEKADLAYSRINLDSMESYSVEKDANQYDIIHDYFEFGYLAGLDAELDEFLDKNEKFARMNKQMAKLRDLDDSKAELYQKARGVYDNALTQFRGDLFNIIKPKLNDCVQKLIDKGETDNLSVDVKQQLAKQYSNELIDQINEEDAE